MLLLNSRTWNSEQCVTVVFQTSSLFETKIVEKMGHSMASVQSMNHISLILMDFGTVILHHILSRLVFASRKSDKYFSRYRILKF